MKGTAHWHQGELNAFVTTLDFRKKENHHWCPAGLWVHLRPMRQGRSSVLLLSNSRRCFRDFGGFQSWLPVRIIWGAFKNYRCLDPQISGRAQPVGQGWGCVHRDSHVGAGTRVALWASCDACRPSRGELLEDKGETFPFISISLFSCRRRQRVPFFKKKIFLIESTNSTIHLVVT